MLHNVWVRSGVGRQCVQHCTDRSPELPAAPEFGEFRDPPGSPPGFQRPAAAAGTVPLPTTEKPPEVKGLS